MLNAVDVTVVVDGVMLPAEDKIMTSSTDESVDDATEQIPLWIGKSSSQTCKHTRTFFDKHIE